MSQEVTDALASEQFRDAIRFVMRDDIEGGYVNDPHDPGGETRYGISRRAYPNEDIRGLTIGRAEFLYCRDYFLPVQGHKLPRIVAVVAFDSAVNQGLGASKKMLQQAAGAYVDGQIGPKTLAAINAADPQALVIEFLSYRLKRYAKTRNADRYMRGWSKRVLFALEYVKQLQVNDRAERGALTLG